MLENIRRMPEQKRERLLWMVVVATLVLLSLLWIITSQIPRHPKDPSAIFIELKEKANRAKADFPR